MKINDFHPFAFFVDLLQLLIKIGYYIVLNPSTTLAIILAIFK